ncbi:type II secretion system F family protein [Roseibacterium sp. SDUM158017]|uniref:type II secretion system F family protein n=1 Tax=Roseicyclus salinarum TaxID=3036773 RepID=UPI0024151512|nr:type II secretion system F family protein [Roseibacterium sp. SDUM158017]MDG4647343.1 type II secretion system F family protein [Roseibacterium sp. SDUM158017]
MDHMLSAFSDLYAAAPEKVVAGVFGLGALLLFLAAASMLRDRNPAAARMARAGARPGRNREDRGLLLGDADPTGIMKGFIPTDRAQRTALQRKLAQAGHAGSDAIWTFTLVRILLGLVLPALFLGLVVVGRMPGVALPLDLGTVLSQLKSLHLMTILATLTAFGYYVPVLWLADRVRERQERIEQAFPNALDLLQISVEAGLGFDTAMTRVGNELVRVSPDIAFEFLSVQRQVQAGRARDRALHDMADRTGVDTVRSFANVVQQSMQFGTSMGEALQAYAREMREIRETKAQEMANKLPVKMSAVLASLMLPALIILTIGPTVIRYMRYFAG